MENDVIWEAELIIGWFDHGLISLDDMDDLPPFHEAREKKHRFYLAKGGFYDARRWKNSEIMYENGKRVIELFNWLESNGYVKERRPYS